MGSQTRAGLAAAALGVVSLLAACGGGSAESAGPSSAGADSASVAWNAPSALDVLANDHSGYGALTLSAVTTPAHGTASIEGGKVVYTPAPGYFGPDSISYTATDGRGGAASASVALSVTATLTLTGTVADAPLAKASLTASAGSASATTTTADDGSYTVKLALADPAAPVLLVATGGGAQSKVKLQSFLGDAASLAATAASDGSLAADRFASTNVNGITTALAASVAEANGGALPATLADFDRQAAVLSTSRIVDLATAIKLVADNGVALPAGTGDTLALIAQPANSAVLAAFLSKQATTNAAAYDAVRATFSSAKLGAAPRVAAAGPQSVVYYTAAATGLGRIVTYRPDGAAVVVDTANGRRTARWAVKDGALDVVLDTPISSTTFSTDLDPVTHGSYDIRTDITGYRYLQISGSTSNGMVLSVVLGSTTIVSGSNTGKVQALDSSSGSLSKVMDLALAPRLAATDFPGGALWAGVQTDLPIEPYNPVDILAINDATKATLQRTGTAYTWSITNTGQLKVTSAAAADRRYTRLAVDPVTGIESWLVADYEGGAPVRATESWMVRATPGLRFTPQASFYRKWLTGFNGFVPTESRLFVGAFAGGTGERGSLLPDGSTTIDYPLTWTIAADGSVTFVHEGITRQWQLLRTQGGRIIVLEDLTVAGDPLWRINAWLDGGPESK